jgi:hypothetical protein
MKECKNIYELKDVLYEKFNYWDVEDLTKSIKRIVHNMVEEQIEDALEEQLSQTAYWQERAEDAETKRDELQNEVIELRKKLEEYEQDDKEAIPF